jgi:conjugative relaxase-like TrwC/TraI family protein
MKPPGPVRSKPAKQRHKSSIRTKRRVGYTKAALAAALNDPGMYPYVVRFGGLFSERKAGDVTVQHLSRAFDACHPDTGRALRARLSSETRLEQGRTLSNRVHGWDVSSLSVDKSISVAALVLGDQVLLEEVMAAMQLAARRLARLVDRRLRRNGANRTVESGLGLAFFIPETAGRFGQPQLHAHVVFANLTRFDDDGRRKYCSAHFQRIAQQALAAQRRMNIRLYQRLVSLGYAVEFTKGTCRLPHVPKELCQKYSPASAQMDASAGKWKGRRMGSSRRAAQRRDNFYLFRRPEKPIKPLTEWQSVWHSAFRPAEFQAHVDAYRAGRLAQVSDTASDNEPKPELVQIAALIKAVSEPSGPVPELTTGAPASDDDALLPFRQLVIAFRQKAGREMPVARRPHEVEVVYECPETVPQLVAQTEAIRSALRLIIPGLIVHQKFSSGSQHTFAAVGAAASDGHLVRLIAQAGAALQMEINRSEAAADWPELVRWLHQALANASPEVTCPADSPGTSPDCAPTISTASETITKPPVPPILDTVVARPTRKMTPLPSPAPETGAAVEVDVDLTP